MAVIVNPLPPPLIDVGLIPVPTAAPTKNQTLIFNGSNPVWAAPGTSFTFSNLSFTANAGVGGGTIGSTTSVLIGSGTWKAIGGISFTASYNNGPPTSANVTSSVTGWGTLAMTGTGKVGPTTNTVAVPYPSTVASNITFTLTASDGTDTDTDVDTFSFINNRYSGLTTKTSGFTSADVVALTAELSNSGSKTFTLTPGSGQYIVFASRTALGTRTFTVGGFTGGFNVPETVSVTNSAGFVENFFVYRSTNPNLGSTTVVVT